MATVAAWFRTVADAEGAVRRLQAAGVPPGDISLLTPKSLRGVTGWSRGALAGKTIGFWTGMLGDVADGAPELGAWGGMVAGGIADLVTGTPAPIGEGDRRAFVAVRGLGPERLAALLREAGGQVVRADPEGGHPL